jgi:hypothetical protein
MWFLPASHKEKIREAMANQKTARERRFAALLLETTKVDAAYRQAGSSQKGSCATQTVDAYRLSKVQREVARLLEQCAFPADDYKRLQATAIAGLTELFLYDPDSRVRLKAEVDLVGVRGRRSETSSGALGEGACVR